LTLLLAAGPECAVAQTISGKCVTITANVTFDGTQRGPLSGATITLLQNGQTVATTTSQGDGTYSFTNVASGTYTVKATKSRLSQPDTNLDPPSRSVTVSGNNVVLDRFALYSIFGVVTGFNSNNQQVPLSGVVVTLVNKNNVAVATRTTNVSGQYEFTLQRAATFTLKPSLDGYTFPQRSRTLPTSGEVFSPIAKANFAGTPTATSRTRPSGNSF
jgi:hypothetical protein